MKKIEPITRHEIGYFGNIWVRENRLLLKGQSNEGHKHYFDHVTLLVKGSAKVEVEGFEPKEFHAPTFIVIKKEHSHKFTALTDDVVWYCVFAIRGEDGEVSDIYSGDNSPYDPAPDDYWEKQQELERKTVIKTENDPK